MTPKLKRKILAKVIKNLQTSTGLWKIEDTSVVNLKDNILIEDFFSSAYRTSIKVTGISRFYVNEAGLFYSLYFNYKVHRLIGHEYEATILAKITNPVDNPENYI